MNGLFETIPPNHFMIARPVQPIAERVALFIRDQRGGLGASAIESEKLLFGWHDAHVLFGRK